MCICIHIKICRVLLFLIDNVIDMVNVSVICFYYSPSYLPTNKSTDNDGKSTGCYPPHLTKCAIGIDHGDISKTPFNSYFIVLIYTTVNLSLHNLTITFRLLTKYAKLRFDIYTNK